MSSCSKTEAFGKTADRLRYKASLNWMGLGDRKWLKEPWEMINPLCSTGFRGVTAPVNMPNRQTNSISLCEQKYGKTPEYLEELTLLNFLILA